MCGIAGYFLRGGEAQLATVRAMCDQIRHRGPDDEGFHVDGSCAIGMRRLSIIDLSTGHQPISNEDGTVWIVFNGEVYNYQELRRELIAKGHRFRTNSDTETIIHLYEEEGTPGIARLRGMFAYAIWDAPKRRLLLARDRFGKKPLYYAALPDGIFFGSELKCLRAAGVPLAIDEEALKLYFRFSYIPDPYSAYKGVRKLPAAGWMTIDADGHTEQGSYWRVPEPAAVAEPGFTREDALRQVREVFDESVRIRMIADVPLGAFLSGGIDSSLIVASMAMQSAEPVKTFSIGFEEAEFNELEYASAVARRYKTDHREILVKPDALNLIARIVDHFDEPFADSASIPTLVMSEETVQYVKVALSGDGGDELFGGYDSFFQVDRLRRIDAIPGIARGALSGVASVLPYSARGKNYLRMISRETPLDRYFELNYAHYFLRKQLLQPRWMLPEGADFLRSILPDCFIRPDADILSQVMYWEATANLTGDMLVKADRMSMAASLEVRCPLLDYKLAELAMRIPHAWKIRNGSGKQILIDAMRDRLPDEILNRKKHGFAVPLAVWFRSSLRGFLRDHIDSERFNSRGFVSQNFVRYLLDEHESGRRDNSHWLWSLLMLELWLRRMEDLQPANGTVSYSLSTAL